MDATKLEETRGLIADALHWVTCSVVTMNGFNQVPVDAVMDMVLLPIGASARRFLVKMPPAFMDAVKRANDTLGAGRSLLGTEVIMTGLTALDDALSELSVGAAHS